METMIRLIGHLGWLSSRSDRGQAKLSLAVYNAANRLKLASYTEAHNSAFAADMRVYATEVAALSIRQHLTERTLPSQYAPSLGGQIKAEIGRMTSCASTHGFEVEDAEWAAASTPPDMEQITKSIAIASKLSNLSAEKPGPYETKVAKALDVICGGLALAANQGKSSRYGAGIARIGLGFLESAHRDIEPKQIPAHLYEQVQIISGILMNVIDAN